MCNESFNHSGWIFTFKIRASTEATLVFEALLHHESLHCPYLRINPAPPSFQTDSWYGTICSGKSASSTSDALLQCPIVRMRHWNIAPLPLRARLERCYYLLSVYRAKVMALVNLIDATFALFLLALITWKKIHPFGLKKFPFQFCEIL